MEEYLDWSYYYQGLKYTSDKTVKTGDVDQIIFMMIQPKLQAVCQLASSYTIYKFRDLAQ